VTSSALLLLDLAAAYQS